MRWPWPWPWHNDPGDQMKEMRRLLAEALRVLDTLTEWEEDVMQQFDDLAVEVGAIQTVSERVRVVIDALVARLSAMQDRPTPEQITALRDDLVAAKEKLAAAVVKGEPGTSEPPPAP